MCAEPKITIIDWLVKCPTILNFAWTNMKFGWTTQYFAFIILVTYKLTLVKIVKFY